MGKVRRSVRVVAADFRMERFFSYSSENALFRQSSPGLLRHNFFARTVLLTNHKK
jgi:hypothetical protein